MGQAARDALDADFGVGIEGNVDDSPLGMYVTGWAAVVDRHAEVGIGAGGRFLLPEHLRLSTSAARIGRASWTRSSMRTTPGQRQGAVGIFTGGLQTDPGAGTGRHLRPHFASLRPHCTRLERCANLPIPLLPRIARIAARAVSFSGGTRSFFHPCQIDTSP
ncbi:MAG: DUF84 family protein [Caldilineaceae bacterium]